MRGHNWGQCRKCGDTHVHPKGTLGKPFKCANPEERARKISASQKGKRLSQFTRDRISASKIGSYVENTINDPIRELPDVEKAWLACFVDTDGGIAMKRSTYMGTDGTVSYNGYQYRLFFTNSDRLILDRVAELVGEKVRAVRPSRDGSHYGKKEMYSVFVHRAVKVYSILRQITPFLIAKKEKAMFVMEEFERRHPSRVY